MNERTRQKRSRQLRRRALFVSLFVAAAAWSFWLIVPNDFVMRPLANFLANGGGNKSHDTHGTVAVGVLGEKVTAQSDSSNNNPLPFVPGPTNVPEPTTLLLLAPAAILMMRRNRRAL